MPSIHDEEVKALMKQVLHVIDGDDGMKPEVAMPALLYATGYLLGHAGHGVPLNVIYAQIVSDIEHARSITASSLEMQEAIERAKEGA